MDSFEINKIIAAVLITVLLIFGIGKVADVVFHVKKPNVQGYKVEVKVGSATSTQASAENQIDISALLALGAVNEGKKIFKKCAACHSISQGGGNKIGPALWGVLGRQAGSISDYKYSKGMAAHGKTWSFEEMNGFLTKPKDWIKGTKMSFVGLKKASERAAVILYMNENTDTPLPLK